MRRNAIVASASVIRAGLRRSRHFGIMEHLGEMLDALTGPESAP
jgi:hypothetical protein